MFEAGIAFYGLLIFCAVTFALIAALHQSYKLVGRGRRLLWTFVLVGHEWARCGPYTGHSPKTKRLTHVSR